MLHYLLSLCRKNIMIRSSKNITTKFKNASVFYF
ncbi:hypothetical protein VIBNIMADA3020_420066 [Vibrio nigripulchritudo MADA3020]|nr:hypothetical protein VIBNIMADA3020_420066 [Vibrio nigripulchritudo MADA3020]CCN56547.1 hypothetical protein VIBNIMADA3021_970042 [Vibrio nigripulchritudo MADA3021]